MLRRSRGKKQPEDPATPSSSVFPEVFLEDRHTQAWAEWMRQAIDTPQISAVGRRVVDFDEDYLKVAFPEFWKGERLPFNKRLMPYGQAAHRQVALYSLLLIDNCLVEDVVTRDAYMDVVEDFADRLTGAQITKAIMEKDIFSLAGAREDLTFNYEEVLRLAVQGERDNASDQAEQLAFGVSTDLAALAVHWKYPTLEV